MPSDTIVFEPPHVGSSRLADFLNGEVCFTQTFNREGPDIVTLVPGGDGWQPCGPRIGLPVPENLGAVQKHQMAAILYRLRVV